MSRGRKVILALADGLGDAVARRELGYVEGLVAAGRARRWSMRAALPSKSRPLYETIHTGLVPAEHGVTTNEVVRPSRCEHVFGIARRHGCRTAASAYAWIAELYLRAPFDPMLDREVEDEQAAIQHGRFYQCDDTPDREVLWTAEMLRWRHGPDYLLIHTMACDWVGHQHGGDSPHYARAARQLDDMLARFVPGWLEDGYVVLLTADHGMDRRGWHGGTEEQMRRVPFYAIGAGASGEAGEVVCQTAVAPTVLALMGLPRPATMTERPLLGETA